MRHPPGKPVLTARSGLLYGGAVGLLIGLIVLAVRPLPEPESVIVWRRFILGGAAIGVLTGLVAGQLRKRAQHHSEKTAPGSLKETPAESAADSRPSD